MWQRTGHSEEIFTFVGEKNKYPMKIKKNTERFYKEGNLI